MEWTPGSYLRIIPELRTSTLHEVQGQRYVKVLYFKEKYDLRIVPEISNFKKVKTIQAMYEVFKSDAVVLELTEPLWMRELIRTILIGYTWKARSFIRRKNNYCFTYAIENNDINSLVYGTVNSHNFLIPYTRKFLRFFISRIYTHAAFGTHAAYENYKENEFLVHIPHFRPSRHSIQESLQTHSLIPETKYVAELNREIRDKLSYLFVGVLEKRKGIDLLIQAWEILDGVGFEGHLFIVGSGSLESKVSQWCLDAPERREYLGFKTGESLDSIYKASDVLLAPSQRDGRWREQVGLPIIEGLSFGLTILTTSETGIAEGLRENGHIVLDDGNNPLSLAKGISEAPNFLMNKDYVKAQVSGRSNREMAFDWISSICNLKSEKNS